MTDLKSRLCERRTTSCLVIEWCHLSRVWLRLWNVWRGSEERAFMYVSCSFLDGLVGQTGDHADTRWETTDALKMYFILFGGSYLPPWFIQPTCTSAANLMNVFSPSHLPKSTAVRWQYAAWRLWPENFDVTPHGFPKWTSSNAHSKCKYNKCFPRFGYAPVDNCQLTKDNWQLPMLPCSVWKSIWVFLQWLDLCSLFDLSQLKEEAFLSFYTNCDWIIPLNRYLIC